MASSQPQFPPQTQDSQPGKEHLMHPRPQFATKDYTPSNKLQGKVAIVTGVKRDAKDTLELLWKAKILDAKDPMAITADLGFEESCKRVVDEVVNAYGKVDILVNNAGQQNEGSIEEIDEKSLERVFRTNFFSQFFMSKYALEHMKEGSSIINTTSLNAYQGYAKLLDYTATKGAGLGFTRALALQVLERGIHVNGVAPGPIWTPLIPSSLTEEEVTQFGLQVPMKRAGQPFEVAPCYVFLACNHCSSYISGQVLHPNGCAIVNG